MAPLVKLDDLEAQAEAVLDPVAFAYYSGGAADEVTLRDNVAAWSRHRLRPRVLVDVSAVDPATTVLGTPVSLPVGIAPTALHGLCAPAGEVATATAAARAGALFTLSSLSSRAMEDVVAEAPPGPRWFQLYAHRDLAITADLVARAAAAGFTAVVVTVDLPVLGRREREARAGYEWGTTSTYGNFSRYAGRGAGADQGLQAFQLRWEHLAWLREQSDLPIVLKGVLTGEDAALACEHGVDAVWVSNHGGRQLDRTPAAVDVLAECVAAVDGRAEVYVDGGVRRGADALVALALGARAVFAGRPWLYALAVGGEDGVAAALRLLRTELEVAMALLGTPTPGSVTRAHLS